MRHSYLLLLFLASCPSMGTSPAAHSPLREQLARADTPTVESAIRACLDKGGWKVDPVGSVSGGANVVSAKNSEQIVQVYIQAPEMHPRITGGPDYGDPFWKCLGGQLASAKAAPAAESDEK